LVAPEHLGLAVTGLAGVDFAAPLGRATCRDVAVAALIDLDHGAVVSRYLTGLAAVASAIARPCLNIASSYANLREQFGRKIGRFQAIKHLCAEMLCRAEQASVLAWDAASAEPSDRPSPPRPRPPSHSTPRCTTPSGAAPLNSHAEGWVDRRERAHRPRRRASCSSTRKCGGSP
jgi:hypothetical protein